MIYIISNRLPILTIVFCCSDIGNFNQRLYKYHCNSGQVIKIHFTYRSLRMEKCPDTVWRVLCVDDTGDDNRELKILAGDPEPHLGLLVVLEKPDVDGSAWLPLKCVLLLLDDRDFTEFLLGVSIGDLPILQYHSRLY